ncbi:hypothetical protein WHR41_08176 [Cladosporium halotolerans]|uniref:Acid phosphatase n=1 Tax=Cladosporium halotolerans TaxID=1052096 RepID=A0AB34KKF8_9PEZI
MYALTLSALAIAGAAAQADIYTATASADVAAAQATAKTSQPTSHVRGKVFDRFVTIWLENTDYDKAFADPNLQWLASQGISVNNYFGVTHPSMPNYIASIGGDTFGCDNDDFKQIDANVSTLIDLLEDKGISWSSYQEDMPYSGFEGKAYVNQQTKANDYVRKHNPPVIFDANTTPERLSAQKNISMINKDASMFHKDLAEGKLPQWMFITPNMTSDGHDTSVTTAGQWCRDLLEPLINDKKSSFWDRTLVLLTFDESETYTKSNRVFSILLGDAVPKHLHGTKDDSYYNHYSEIATVEANWDLHTLGRFDVGANVFDFVGKKTGDHIRPWAAATDANPSIFFNSSYAGPLNENFETAPYEAPNVNIKSPGSGRTVLPAIVEKWGGKSLPTPPKYGMGPGPAAPPAPGKKPGKENPPKPGDEASNATYYTDKVEIPDGQHPPPGFDYNDAQN